VFEAIAATGFDFTGWYLDDVLLSDEVIAQITVTSGENPGDIVTFEARFAPVS
jgi:uncharacterized repeat protein (TIGR02543 family)